MKKYLLFIILAILLVPGLAFGETYYLHPSGAGTSNESKLSQGCSLGTAACSMAEATFITFFEAGSMADNDTFSVYRGTYDMTGFACTVTDDNIAIQGEGENTIWQDGGQLVFTESFTIDDMKFDSYNTAPFKLLANGAGEDGDGIAIRDSYFTNPDSLYTGVFTDTGSDQTVNGFTFTGNTIGNGSVDRCRIINLSNATISNVTITGNTIGNITVTGSYNTVFQIGDNGNDASTVTVSSNTFGSLSSPSGLETHYVLAYGSSITIDSNNNGTTNTINIGNGHEALYIKGSDSTISNNTLINTGAHDGSIVIKSSTSNNVVHGNTITSNIAGTGIYVMGTSGSVYNNTIDVIDAGIRQFDSLLDGNLWDIYNNRVKSVSGSAIRLDNFQYGNVRGNVVTGSTGYGINVSNDCLHPNIVGNSTSGFAYGIYHHNTVTTGDYYNNIFWDASTKDAYLQAGFSGNWNYNNASTYTNDPGAANDISTDPNFFNAPTSLSLKSISGAIDAGTTIKKRGFNVILSWDFAADTNWTKDTWTIAAGTADIDGSQAGDADLTQTVAPLTGSTDYFVVFTISDYTENGTDDHVCVVAGTQEGTDRSANGTYTETITANGTAAVIRAGVDFDGKIDKVYFLPISTITTDYNGNTVPFDGLSGSAGGNDLPDIGAIEATYPTTINDDDGDITITSHVGTVLVDGHNNQIKIRGDITHDGIAMDITGAGNHIWKSGLVGVDEISYSATTIFHGYGAIDF